MMALPWIVQEELALRKGFAAQKVPEDPAEECQPHRPALAFSPWLRAPQSTAAPGRYCRP